MQIVPQTAVGRTLAVLGALALLAGVLGVASPEAQLRMMGFPVVASRAEGDYTAAVLATTSLSAVNTGVLYLLGAGSAWPRFAAYASFARIVMGAGLLVLATAGAAPRAFVGGAAWEWAGALAIGLAALRDRRGAGHVRASSPPGTGARECGARS